MPRCADYLLIFFRVLCYTFGQRMHDDSFSIRLIFGFCARGRKYIVLFIYMT